MSCCGKHMTMDGKPVPKYDAHNVRPTEECVFCAEKHLATAYALAQENGYADANRYRIIGELVEAQWHIWRKSVQLAEMLRAMRHEIQMRNEASVDWREPIKVMNIIAETELNQNREK